jgi:Putative beta-lactamase-inhibitor-like, PepSY-like
MKKYIFMFAVIAAINLSAHAQKMAAARVPTVVKATFAKQFAGATAKWEKENGEYEAGFTMDGKDMSALFTADGKLMESEVSMKPSELSAKILAYIKANYKDKKIKGGAKITKADGVVNYEAEVNGVDVMFDANGKFLKEVKDYESISIALSIASSNA